MKNVLIIGHSHILALRTACNRAKNINAKNNSQFNFDFLVLREKPFQAQTAEEVSNEQKRMRTSTLSGINKQAIKEYIAQAKPDIAVLCINGNEHSGIGMIRKPAITQATKLARMSGDINTKLSEWLNFLLPMLPDKLIFFPSPPPIDAPSLTGLFPEERISRFSGHEFEPIEFRLRAWLKYCETTKSLCADYGVNFIDLPADVFKANGFLSLDCYGSDPIHGNPEYGRRMLNKLMAAIAEITDKTMTAPFPSPAHPYKNLPDYAFWKQAITDMACAEVDPVTNPPFTISHDDKVATAGSCFAQHISKRLRESGFNFLVTETPNAQEETDPERGFYDFSARYGNIYTARQLLQLFDRAFGYFQPLEQIWERREGGFCDPFRPRLEPAFNSEKELRDDTKMHLQAVRRMFIELDVFVFTLGLTECYLSRLDGAVYPLAPGVTAGHYNPEQHVFVNFKATEIITDLHAFIAKLSYVNPKAKVILTISPVPLVATAAQRHVLVSTVYSKSALRVAAEEIAESYPHVYYFPSYEIITGSHASNNYFDLTRRSVTEQGVDHVMRVFMARMTDHYVAPPLNSEQAAALTELDDLVETICDEEMLAR